MSGQVEEWAVSALSDGASESLANIAVEEFACTAAEASIAGRDMPEVAALALLMRASVTALARELVRLGADRQQLWHALDRIQAAATMAVYGRPDVAEDHAARADAVIAGVMTQAGTERVYHSPASELVLSALYQTNRMLTRKSKQGRRQ